VRNANKIFVGKPEEKRPCGTPRRWWEGNIRRYLRETGWEVVDWLHLAQDRDQWRVAANTVINLRLRRGTIKGGKFLNMLRNYRLLKAVLTQWSRSRLGFVWNEASFNFLSIGQLTPIWREFITYSFHKPTPLARNHHIICDVFKQWKTSCDDGSPGKSPYPNKDNISERLSGFNYRECDLSFEYDDVTYRGRT
jgi:hypothetical protein